MSETEFTPGPWGLSKEIEVWVKAGPLHVATIPRGVDGDWSPANANLIAAAPEMYESLEDCVENLAVFFGEAEEIKRARAVLAKARGESQ